MLPISYISIYTHDDHNEYGIYSLGNLEIAILCCSCSNTFILITKKQNIHIGTMHYIDCMIYLMENRTNNPMW